ncbi:hypothetical protein B0H13DRAFT_1892905 [Mycena leptocephala]|nr:hypothetical protein B0H13DRAFT_1892905 [Mycena leptocephala]
MTLAWLSHKGSVDRLGEVHEFVNDPDPMLLGDLAHGLRNPPPGDRSNWMRDSKAHLENKHISMASRTVYDSQKPGTHDALDARNAVSGLSKVRDSRSVNYEVVRIRDIQSPAPPMSFMIGNKCPFRCFPGLMRMQAKAQELDFVGVSSGPHSAFPCLENKPDRVQDLIATFRDIFTRIYVTKSHLEQHARPTILSIAMRSFSPPENPSTADDYTTVATSSLMKWGAENQNQLALGRLRNLQLGGRERIIILDFPEYEEIYK